MAPDVKRSIQERDCGRRSGGMDGGMGRRRMPLSLMPAGLSSAARRPHNAIRRSALGCVGLRLYPFADGGPSITRAQRRYIGGSGPQ